MRNQFNHFWSRVSRIGLHKDEGVLDFREVIFLNRMLAILPVIMFTYIPLEIYINGFSMLHVVGIMIVLFLVPFPLHYYRLFKIAHYYIFLIGNILITCAGLLVGKGINNHVTLVPVVLLGIILFKTKVERITALLVTVAFFLFQNYLFDIIPPQIVTTAETKAVFSLIFFLLALLLSFLTGFYFIGINSEYEKIVNEQKEAIAFKNKEITDSITYAKRIQKAILPPELTVKEYLPDSFILYQPKDIVAGDFYWMEKIDDTVLFAAADSTGHGVPGAMVSLVCYNALSRSVREFGLTEPAKIFDKTREIIIREFEKSEEEVKDGMDISLCALNLETGKLQWAGANNPLWIVRQNNEDNKYELTEFKPNKQPIGKTDHPSLFSTHHIELQKDDTLYLCTDGYADQFGGATGKKLKKNNLKKIILDLAHLPLQEQSQLLNFRFKEWKGDLEQVDDVCVIGVRV